MIRYFLATTLLIGLFTSLQGLASNYPPDYPNYVDCSPNVRPVRVCRQIGGDWISLKVYYEGFLLNTEGADESLRV